MMMSLCGGGHDDVVVPMVVVVMVGVIMAVVFFGGSCDRHGGVEVKSARSADSGSVVLVNYRLVVAMLVFSNGF